MASDVIVSSGAGDWIATEICATSKQQLVLGKQPKICLASGRPKFLLFAPFFYRNRAYVGNGDYLMLLSIWKSHGWMIGRGTDHIGMECCCIFSTEFRGTRAHRPRCNGHRKKQVAAPVGY